MLNMKISYIDFWSECENCPINFDEINDPNSWNNFILSRKLKIVQDGVGLFHIQKLEKILNEKIELTTPNNADILICSGFGSQKYLYPTKKKICLYYESAFKTIDKNLSNTIYFSSELSTDHDNFYLPLFTCYYGFNIYKLLFSPRNILDSETFAKKSDCLSIISNGSCSFRNNFLTKVMEKIKVDNYGKLAHNINSCLESSCWYDPRICSIATNYKFMICMENTSQLGYHTEKIMHGFRNNIIPIYWGDPNISLIFNSNAYININELGVDKAIEKIVLLCNNLSEYNKMMLEPILKDDSIIFKEEFKNFFNEDYFIEKIKTIFKS
jgi:hypothetical protein